MRTLRLIILLKNNKTATNFMGWSCTAEGKSCTHKKKPHPSKTRLHKFEDGFCLNPFS